MEDHLDTLGSSRHLRGAQPRLVLGQSKMLEPLSSFAGMVFGEPDPLALQRSRIDFSPIPERADRPAASTMMERA